MILESEVVNQYSSVRAEPDEFQMCRDVASESSTEVIGKHTTTELYWDRWEQRNLVSNLLVN